MRVPKNAHLWLPGWTASRIARLSRTRRVVDPVHLLLCIADHFEPNNRGADKALQRQRVCRWIREYPGLATRLRDADGRPLQHTFFFPAETYDPDLVSLLEELCSMELAEVEVHLHHDRDTSANLRARLSTFVSELVQRHRLLSRDRDGRPAYGFVHGNWALDNSLPGGRHCGVNDELSILMETGCYADFTMPSVPHESQSRIVNAVYHAIDDPDRPASHRRGPRARVGRAPDPAALLMIPGPLSVAWGGDRSRRWVPSLDVGAIDHRNRPTPARFARWVQAGVSVAGRPEWIFIKLHTHGAPESNADVLLGPAMAEFHESIAIAFNDGARFRLHYVTARELANIANAAIDGYAGDPNQFRDYRYRLVRRS